MPVRSKSHLPWIVLMFVFSGLCLLIGLIALAVGTGNEQGECQTVHGNSITYYGCVGDTTGTVWGPDLAFVGIVFVGVTLSTGAMTSAVARRGSNGEVADAEPVSAPVPEA